MAPVDAPFARAVDKYRGTTASLSTSGGTLVGLAAMMMGLSGHFVGEVNRWGDEDPRQRVELRANPRVVDTNGKAVSVFDGPVAILVDAMRAVPRVLLGRHAVDQTGTGIRANDDGQALPALFDRLPNGDVMIMRMVIS